MTRQPITLIFDIGKTTKKVLVFDRDFHALEEQTETFAEIIDDDGFPCENVEAVTNWVDQAFAYFLNHSKYLVTHVNFSAYGASLVHIDRDGRIVKPFYNYLKTLPEDCKHLFLEKYNAKNDISSTTASPFLGLLNSGLQLFWMKYKKPDLFSSITTTLHFPQYFTYLLTRKKWSEITSIGCHTMLWDFETQDYHPWVESENLKSLLPPVRHANFTTDCLFNDTTVRAGIGVHDSSAALMPYLAVMKEKFMLLSTGTWNICFNPFNHRPLTNLELAQDCLCFLTFDGNPVKASRIFLGHEHELQQRALAVHFKVDPEFYKTIQFNDNIYQRLNKNNGWIDFKPLGMEGSGPILTKANLETNYASLNNLEEAQHQLVRQLVRWQKISVDLLDPDYQIKNLIVVGGFTKSNLFLQIMKMEMPERKILISDHPRASALGAAWLVCGKEAYADKMGMLNVIGA